jgi:hypothetical protein
MRLLGGVLVCLIWCCPSLAADRGKPISKLEARQLAPEALKRRVLDQLGDILVEAPRPQGRRVPTRPLTDLWYYSRPRVTWHVGLCAYDTVVVTFRAVGDRERGAETPMRAEGLSGHTSYAFIRAPSEVEADESRPTATDQAACARHTDRQAYFRSESEQVALEGGLRLELMRMALEGSGSPPFPVTCEGSNLLAEEACRSLLVARGLERVSEIERCHGEPAGGPGAACWRYSTDGPEGTYDIEVHGPYGPVQIGRVVAKRTIVLWHERVD